MNAGERPRERPVGRGWSRAQVVTLALGLAAAALLRLALLPTAGLPGDLDVFAGWTHLLATDVPLGSIYDHDMSFGPAMAYLFWLVAHLQPVFATVADGSDPLARAWLKLAPAAADIAIALAVAWALADRPRVAVASALAVAVVPVTWYTSAFWGQYESIYTLFALLAAVLAARGRWVLAGVMLGLALGTKPQVLVLVVPLAAFAIARVGVRRSLVPAAAAAVTLAFLWLPFVAASGPVAYLRSVAAYQGEAYAVLSLRAWNPWWILQSSIAGSDLLADGTAILGPLSPRLIGYLAAAAGLALVFVAVRRQAAGRAGTGRPDAVAGHEAARALYLGMAAASLVAYCLLTAMHERYAYPAVVFLALLLSERRLVATWVVLVVTTTANYLAAAPPGGRVGAPVPIAGAVATAGSAAITGVLIFVLTELVRSAGSGPSVDTPGSPWEAGVPAARRGK